VVAVLAQPRAAPLRRRLARRFLWRHALLERLARGRDFDHYRDVSPRFCSEFGFQSYPSMDVIRRFAAPEDLNIASPVMEAHQKNKGGNARIAETMFRYFRFPESVRGLRLPEPGPAGAGDPHRRDALARA
jgi:hypothetical protein